VANSNLVLNGGPLEYTGATHASSRSLTLVGGNGGIVNVSEAATELTLSAVNGSSSDFGKAGAGTFSLAGLAYSAVLISITLLIGILLFNKVERTFMDTV
jgi:hypothetical protein